MRTEVGWAQFRKLAELVPETELDADARWRATMGLLDMMLTQDLSSKLMVPITNSDRMKMAPGVTNVAKGYVEMGLTAQHIPAMKSSFLWTMGQYLGSDFDSEMKEAWGRAFDLVKEALQAATPVATPLALPQKRNKPIAEGSPTQLKKLFRK